MGKGGVFPNFPRQLDPTHPGHHPVRNHQINRNFGQAEGLQRIAAVLGLENLGDPHLLQHTDDDLAQVFNVIDHQYDRIFLIHLIQLSCRFASVSNEYRNLQPKVESKFLPPAILSDLTPHIAGQPPASCPFVARGYQPTGLCSDPLRHTLSYP